MFLWDNVNLGIFLSSDCEKTSSLIYLSFFGFFAFRFFGLRLKRGCLWFGTIWTFYLILFSSLLFILLHSRCAVEADFFYHFYWHETYWFCKLILFYLFCLISSITEDGVMLIFDFLCFLLILLAAFHGYLPCWPCIPSSKLVDFCLILRNFGVNSIHDSLWCFHFFFLI